VMIPRLLLEGGGAAVPAMPRKRRLAVPVEMGQFRKSDRGGKIGRGARTARQMGRWKRGITSVVSS
jgi:hypothetical protein